MTKIEGANYDGFYPDSHIQLYVTAYYQEYIVHVATYIAIAITTESFYYYSI